MKAAGVRITLSSGTAGALALYLSAIVFALVFVGIFGQQKFSVEALQLRLNLRPAVSGYTVVEIPPLATIKARTHSTPVKVSIRLENIDMQALQKMMDEQEINTGMVKTASERARSAVILLTLKVLALSAVGGAFGIFLWDRRPGIKHIKGALAASLTTGLLLTATLTSYNVNGFKNPEYYGALKTAPWIVELAAESLGKIDNLNIKMETIAGNIHQLFNQIDQLQVYDEAGEVQVKVLHVSDIHNNPAAMAYIQRIASLFSVDMIIDTGDITDYGTPMESLLLERLQGLDFPYLFVPGNHDSPETVKKMKSIPGVTVLDRTVNLAGLRIKGFPDPSSESGGIEPPSPDEITRYAGEIEKELSSQDRPDILAVHNHRIARMLAGKAPVILFGHDHRLAVEEKDGSILIDAGSSGAAGLRRLQGDTTPYSVVIQYYSPVDGIMQLKAADTITVKNLESGFHLERHIF